MIAIIPIFPINKNEISLLNCNIDGTPLYRCILDKLINLGVSDIRVFTNQKNIFYNLSPLNSCCYIDINHKDIAFQAQYPCLPYGTEYILNTFNNISDDIAIFDYRNSHLKESTINNAINTFNTFSENALFSAHKSHDHPIQFDLYHNILLVDLICTISFTYDIATILKDTPITKGSFLNNNDYFVSNPLYFNWSKYNGYSKKLQNKIALFTLHGQYYTTSWIEDIVQTTVTDSFYIMADDRHARRVVRKNRCTMPKNADLVGLSFRRKPAKISSLILIDKNRGDLDLYLPQTISDEPLRVRMWPIFGDRIAPYFQEISYGGAKGKEQEGEVSVFTRKYRNIGKIPLQKESLTGLILVVLQDVHEGKAHGKAPLLPRNCLWNYDHKTRERIASVSHSPIHGRQDFPDLLESDGSFVMAKPSWFHRYLNLPDSHSIFPYEIKNQDTIKITSIIDILKYNLNILK